MPTLDYTLNQFSFKVGDIEFADYSTSLNLNAPYYELGQPLWWTGQFAVNWVIRLGGHPETMLDQDFRPDLWRPGQAIVKIVINGFAFPWLRIEDYKYNEATQTGEGNLKPLAGLFQRDRPSTQPDIEINQSPLLTVATALVNAAAFKTRVPLQVSLTGLTGDLDSPISTRNPISEAQRLCEVNWQWLSHGATEQVVTIDGDPRQHPARFARSLSEVVWQPDVGNINFAASRVIATGNRQVPDPSRDCPDENASDKSELTRKGRQRLHKTNTEGLYKDVFKIYDTDGSQDNRVITEEKVIFYRYVDEWALDTTGTNYLGVVFFGMPEIYERPDWHFRSLATGKYPEWADPESAAQTVTVTRKPKGVIFPRFKRQLKNLGQLENLIVAEVEISSNEFRVTYVPESSMEKNPHPNTVFGGEGVLAMQLRDRENLQTDRSEGTRSGEKDPNTNKPKCFEPKTQPEPRQLTPDRPQITQPLKAECNVLPANWTPIWEDVYTQDFGFVPTPEHMQKLACALAVREAARRDAVFVTMPLPPEWAAAGFKPLDRCYIHNSHLYIDAPIIQIQKAGDSYECRFSFNGGKLDKIAPPIAPPPALPPIAIDLTSPNTGIQPFVAPAAITAPVGVSIYLRLEVFE